MLALLPCFARGFLVLAHSQSKASKAAKQVIDQAKSQQEFVNNPSAVLENAAKLVDAFTKAGPAIASLGASIAALGFAAYVVAQIGYAGCRLSYQ